MEAIERLWKAAEKHIDCNGHIDPHFGEALSDAVLRVLTEGANEDPEELLRLCHKRSLNNRLRPAPARRGGCE